MGWNKDKRIEELTLEDFHGYPRVSSWIPRHQEVKKIASYMNLVRSPKMLDTGCGSGLASILFALEGIDALGADHQFEQGVLTKTSQMPNLRFLMADAFVEKIYRGRNIMFNSWMPAGINMEWSGCLANPQLYPLITYVKSQATGAQPGMQNNFNNFNTYALPFGYVELDRWNCFGHDDFISEADIKLGSKVGEVLIFAEKGFYDSKLDSIKKIQVSRQDIYPYPWESDLPKIKK